MYAENSDQSTPRFSSKRYIPGDIANLPSRNRPSVYRHSGHTRNEIREHYPHFTEISGGFAELVIGGVE